MDADLAAALTFLESLSRVGLTERLRSGDPELTEQARTRLVEARAARIAAGAQGSAFVGWNDPRFPAPLGDLSDMPPGLWFRGDLACLHDRSVAVIGSRAGSRVALETATLIAGELASRGVVIVSGLARGVDSAAHRAALAANGQTVAVLGSGLNRIYPAEHRALAVAIEGRGAVVTEYPPEVPPLPFHFPMRNRIISGLSRAVVVIEASEQSGSLITAACALEQGREVMAVPGNVLSGRNRGGHALIRDGATIVETADDILDALGWREHLRSRPSGIKPTSAAGSVACLIDTMECGVVYEIDRLAAEQGLDAARLLAQLTALELGGHVRRVAGGGFVRAVRTC